MPRPVLSTVVHPIYILVFAWHASHRDMEDTNYYLSVTTQHNDPDTTSEGLEGALDRFSQFFISPLFKPEMAERELRAIDSEYRNGKTNDSWRNFQFVKSTSNPKNPFSNFGW